MHVHRWQVVHRDFKTSNILVDAKWNGVVADFGLARRMKSRGGAVHEPLPPECTVVMGTFGYVAPEYARTGVISFTAPIIIPQEQPASLSHSNVSLVCTCQLSCVCRLPAAVSRVPYASQAR